MDADQQIVWAGLAVVAVLAALFAWNAIFGGDDEATDAVAGVTTIAVGGGADGDGDLGTAAAAAGAAAVDAVTGGDDADDDAEADADAGADDADDTDDDADEEAATTTTAAPTTTTEAAPTIGDVQAAVGGFPGAITGSNDGTTAVLEGFVADQSESDEAEAAAAAVEGIEVVDNRLGVLVPDVTAALEGAGVMSAGVAGEGTVMTVSGTVQSEDDRTAALDAAAAIPGVTEVVDELDVSVAADLNALPQVQFAYNSAVILEDSFADLDAAAAMIAEVEGVELRVEGYTDVQGPAGDNLVLSQQRADAVRGYLLDAGVDPAVLTAEGFGETEQFGEGNSAEALAANRLVRFVEVG
ncbi:MAG: OmpA family protein [Actinomycetota bacterium]